MGRGLEQGQPNDAVVHMRAELAVVEQARAVPVLADIQPLVMADLKAREVPARVVVRGTLDVSVLDLIRRLGGADVQREQGFSCQSISQAMSMRGTSRYRMTRCTMRLAR